MVICFIKCIDIILKFFLLRSLDLFTFLSFILSCVSHYFFVLSLLTYIILSQFKPLNQISNSAAFMQFKDGLTIRNISKRVVAFVFAVL